MSIVANPGEKQTFDEFYQQYFVFLTRWVVKHIGARPHEAEDVVQEAMAQAYQKWHTLRSPLAWVKKACNTELTKVINRARKEAELRRALGKDDAVDGPSGHDTEVVREALRNLPEAQREVFAFTYDGLKPNDIAPIVNKSPEAVRANLREARRRLRAEYDNKNNQRRGQA